MPAGSDAWDPLSRAQWLEMTTLLPGYILSSQGDRMLMANSVEGRFPFLDQDVVEFANRLPARHKLFGLDEKHLLKTRLRGPRPRARSAAGPSSPTAPPTPPASSAAPPPEWLAEVTSPAALADGGRLRPRGRSPGCSPRPPAPAAYGPGNTDNMRLLAVVSTQLLHQQLVVDAGSASDDAPPAPMTVIDRVQHVRSTA